MAARACRRFGQMEGPLVAGARDPGVAGHAIDARVRMRTMLERVAGVARLDPEHARARREGQREEEQQERPHLRGPASNAYERRPSASSDDRVDAADASTAAAISSPR